MFLRQGPFLRAPVELAEAEVAVGDERSHAARFGERQRLALVTLPALGVEPVWMGRDVAEQVQGVGSGSWARPRIFERAVAQAPRLVESAKPQSGTTHQAEGGPVEGEDPLRCVAVEELLGFPEPGQRLSRLAELCEDPGGGGDHEGKLP